MEKRIIKDINNLLTQLFQKIEEAGYQWDAKKKELKLLISNGGDFESPTWSEVDERMLSGIIDEIEANKREAPSYDIPLYDMYLNWLKSLEDRVKPQNTWKPSNEQMEVLLSEVTALEKGCHKQIVLGTLYNDLKKLK